MRYKTGDRVRWLRGSDTGMLGTVTDVAAMFTLVVLWDDGQLYHYYALDERLALDPTSLITPEIESEVLRG